MATTRVRELTPLASLEGIAVAPAVKYLLLLLQFGCDESGQWSSVFADASAKIKDIRYESAAT